MLSCRATWGVAAVGGLALCAALVIPWSSGRGFEPDATAPAEASEWSPGGATSVDFRPSPSFRGPAANLGPEARREFYAGRALAGQPWVRAPSSTDARDGLGPLYNARTCFECHVEGGHGLAPNTNGELSVATLVRLSVPYGAQLQPRSIALGDQLAGVVGSEEVLARGVPPEGRAHVTWIAGLLRYADGETVQLRRPKVRLEALAHGALRADAMIALRHAPPLHGLGLLELVAQADLERLADPDDADGDGISGRVNRVWDPSREARVVGRFGLKANQATLRVQVAAALHGDIGITSTVLGAVPCTYVESACAASPHGAPDGEPEISDALLDLLTDFNRSIGVPRRRAADDPLVQHGRELFGQAGCDACHAPRFVTHDDPRWPHLSRQTIWPYTDLLLHDMGDALADGRPDGEASGSEWRTPPLWGVGLARAVHRDAGLLHDGRARTVEEAILWHGGEAQRSRNHFVELTREERRALLSFVRSL